MALKDTVIAMADNPKGPGCSVQKVRAQLDTADNATLTDLFKSEHPSTFIAKVLEADGIRVAGKVLQGGTIHRHRKGDCSCGAL